MDNVNFDAKTDWKLNDTVMPADANRWEKGIDDTAKLANHLNETKLDESKADEEFKDKADIDLKNTRFLTNCIIGSKNGILDYTLGTKGNYTIIGKPTISSSQVVSNIDANNRVEADIVCPVANETLLAQGEVMTPSSWSGTQTLMAIKTAAGSGSGILLRVLSSGVLQLHLSSNGTSWNIVEGRNSAYVMPTNTRVQFKLYWNKYDYFLMIKEEGETSFKTVIDVISSLPVCATNKFTFGTNANGIEVFNGSVYLESYSLFVDGQRILNSTNAIPVKDVTISPAGIVSGFNYNTGSQLVLDKSDVAPNSSFELVTKFKMTSLATYGMMFDSLNGTTLQLRVNTTGTISLWVGNGSSYNSLSEALVSTAIEVNKWYWLKLIWTGSLWILFLSENGTYWKTYQVWFSENQPIVTKTNIFFGFDKGYGYTFDGEIDLNETYVKIDGAVVTGANFVNSGCTVENGVASGFGVSKILTVNKWVNAPTKNLIHKFKLHTPEVWTARTRQFFVGCPNGNIEVVLFYVSNAGVPYCYLKTGAGAQWNIMSAYELRANGEQFILPTDSDVWIKLIWEGTGYIPQISLDGVNFKSGRRLSSTAAHGRFLASLGNLNYSSSELYDGALDLKECSFKVDGDYKFDGANLITLNEAKIENGVLSFPVPQNMNGAFYPKRTPAEAANSWEVIVNVHSPNSDQFTPAALIFGNAQSVGLRFYFENNHMAAAWSSARIILGTTTILPNSDYWVGLKYDGAGYSLYLLKDDGAYSLDTLPDFSSWSQEGATYANTTDFLKDIMFTLGYTWEDNTYFLGSINLAKTRIKRNGEVFWQWNEKDGDNVDLIDYEDGWVFNGKPEQNQFELSGDKAWEWNKVNILNPKLSGGQIWDLVNPITGTMVVKEGMSALVKKGYKQDGTLDNLHKLFEQDTAVVIPYEQNADKIVYVNDTGALATIDTKNLNTLDGGAVLARFQIEDYVIKAVTPERAVELFKKNPLVDEIIEEGWVDNPSGNDTYGKIKFTRFKSGRLRLEGTGVARYTFPIPFAKKPDIFVGVWTGLSGDFENPYMGWSETQFWCADKYERGWACGFIVEGVELK